MTGTPHPHLDFKALTQIQFLMTSCGCRHLLSTEPSNGAASESSAEADKESATQEKTLQLMQLAMASCGTASEQVPGIEQPLPDSTSFSPPEHGQATAPPAADGSTGPAATAPFLEETLQLMQSDLASPGTDNDQMSGIEQPLPDSTLFGPPEHGQDTAPPQAEGSTELAATPESQQDETLSPDIDMAAEHGSILATAAAESAQSGASTEPATLPAVQQDTLLPDLDMSAQDGIVPAKAAAESAQAEGSIEPAALAAAQQDEMLPPDIDMDAQDGFAPAQAAAEPAATPAAQQDTLLPDLDMNVQDVLAAAESAQAEATKEPAAMPAAQLDRALLSDDHRGAQPSGATDMSAAETSGMHDAGIAPDPHAGSAQLAASSAMKALPLAPSGGIQSMAAGQDSIDAVSTFSGPESGQPDHEQGSGPLMPAASAESAGPSCAARVSLQQMEADLALSAAAYARPGTAEDAATINMHYRQARDSPEFAANMDRAQQIRADFDWAVPSFSEDKLLLHCMCCMNPNSRAQNLAARGGMLANGPYNKLRARLNRHASSPTHLANVSKAQSAGGLSEPEPDASFPTQVLPA